MEPWKFIQFIFGSNNRTAGNDYHEHQHIHFPDPKHWLEWAPMEEQDKLAIDNERFFERRFGFSASGEQRRHVIAIKKRFDFTDLEIQNLRASRLLTCMKGKPTSLCADSLVHWLYILMMVATICLMLLCAFLCNSVHGFFWLKLVCTVVFTSLAFIFGQYFYSISIKPLNTLRQRGFKLGEKFVLRDQDNTTPPDQP